MKNKATDVGAVREEGQSVSVGSDDLVRTPKMKLAKATQTEIDTLMRWLQSKESAKFEDAKNRPPAFMRVVFGYETLVNNCCDPTADTLEWKPGYAPSDTDRLRAGIEEALMHLDTNYDIDGQSMKDSDAALSLALGWAPII